MGGGGGGGGGHSAEVVPAPAEAQARCDLALETRPQDAAALARALREAGVEFRLHRL